MSRAFVLKVVALPLLSGCASAGTKPGDMTAARHEAAAVAAEEEGARHDRQYDPNARTQAPCSPYARELCSTPESFWNPTEAHGQQGTQYRRFAAKHRAASEALRAAEARACAGISDIEREASPFRRRDIERVEAIEEKTLGRDAVRGARVVLRDQAGASRDELQRLIDCHLAHWAVTGAQDPAVPSCPLALEGVTVEVKNREKSIAVEILAQDPRTAATVIANARALVPARIGVESR